TKPWYADYTDNPYVLYGGTGGILLLIAGWLMTRASGGKKPNPRPLPAAGAVAAAEATDADPHADLEREAESYYEGGSAAAAVGSTHADHETGEEDEMELLRSHFDHGDSDRFVALAHSLREKFPEDSAEWREVSDLGRQLLPGSPLFAASALAAHDGHDADDFFFRDEATHAGETVAENEHDAQIHSMLDNDKPLAFESRDMAASDSRDLPDLEFEQTFHKEVDAVTESPIEDDQAGAGRQSFLDEDTIGTRLDLARAYLDMGDPEGARSMLDEVLAEGSDTQKEEARKLLAELS
ncbi:FimV/HubP family polar landmark protein, partial [Rudaea sp.]|uniref:FimV/HubP family polar landmark protein n=1 Tax=Rudaea sp. TaxID=2136325 RepID=UPI002ED1DC84